VQAQYCSSIGIGDYLHICIFVKSCTDQVKKTDANRPTTTTSSETTNTNCARAAEESESHSNSNASQVTIPTIANVGHRPNEAMNNRTPM
jgi:hypothetical protein